MNRQTMLAFALLLGIVMFFTSPWYKEHVIGVKPDLPSSTQTTQPTRPLGVSPSESMLISDTTKQQLAQAKNSPLGQSIDIASISAESHDDTIWITTNKMKCGISEKGGRIISLRMLDYKYHTESHLFDSAAKINSFIELAQYQNNIGAANLTIGATNYDDKQFLFCGSSKQISVAGEDSVLVKFGFIDGSSDTLFKTFLFHGKSNRIQYCIEWSRLSGQPVRVGWDCGIRESEMGSAQNAQQYSKITVHYFDGRNVENITFKELKDWDEKRPSSGNYWWLALTSKYFLVALIPDTVQSTDLSVVVHKEILLRDTKKTDFYNYGIAMTRTAESNQEKYWIYAGPSQLNELRGYKVNLEKVLFSGWKWMLWANVWFPIICEYLLIILLWINNLVKDYGISIILITILVKVITYPLSVSSMRSMSKMKVLQPKITAIRDKYKSNPTKMNQSIMAMYKEEGVNPLNPGCLPMFLQMPLLIALYVVLMKAIELRGAATWLVPWVKDLSQPEILFKLPFSIPMYGENFALIPVIMALVTFVQNKMTMKDPNQLAMVYVMPIFMFILFNNFPAGLVIYWTFSSVLGIAQQYLIEKTMPKAVTVVAANQKIGSNISKKSK